MKKAKRALALALVFALVASFCVTGAAAVDEPVPGYSDTYVQNGGAVTTEDGVIVSKRAEYVSKNEYEITLEVTIPDNVTVPGTDTDVVLVIDRSNSMNDDGKLESAKNAAMAFANTLLADSVTAEVQLAVVSYNRTADIECGLTASGSQVANAVDGIRADGSMNGGTNIQAGIHEAREILSSSTADKKVIVVLSDGEPTYSYPVKGTSGWSGCVDNVPLLGHSWYGIDFSGGPANINLPDKNAVTESDFDYTRTTGSGGSYDSGVYAILNVECIHKETMKYEYGGDERPYTNNGDPTIAEADFAREDGCEVYGLYLGEPNNNAKYTMEGVADTGKYEQASGESLSGLLQEIAGSVTSTTAGAVTDPMGENIQLGDVSGLDGVSVSGNTLFWNPSNGEPNPDGSTTYTVTYPITVDGEKLTASDWVYANGTTTFSYKVNGELKTVDFNVPQVWGEKVETETPQNVYVYVRVVNDDESPLTDEQISQIRGWGLTTLNDSGYYTIGMIPDVQLPVASAEYNDPGLSESEIDAVAEQINNLIKHDDNEGFIIDDKVEWDKLHTDAGANGYPEAPNPCWHLNGQITIDELKQELVTVTYNKNAEDATGMMEDQSVIKGLGVTLRENGYELEGYTFTGWNTKADGTGTGYENGEHIDALNEDLTLYAQWAKNTNTAYKVEHYQEQLDGTFELSETDNLAGTTGEEVTATPNSYTGFTFDEDNEDNITSGTIAGDGSLVLKLYYVRETYTVAYTDGVEGEEVFADQTYDGLTYGEDTPDFLVDGSPADPKREGYTFEGWSPEVAETVTETVTYMAQWKEITGTLTVTKTVEGLEGNDTLPSNFSITVTGPGDYKKELTLSNADEGTTYTWTIGGLSLGTYTVTEDNYAVEGYLCNGANGSATLAVNGEGPVTATVALTNSYTPISRELSVVKTVIKVGETDVEEGAAIPAAKVGETIIYKIVVTNKSNVALENISVTDTLDGQPLTVYTDADCESVAGNFDLAAGDSETFYAQYKVTAADAEAGFVKNTATASDGDTTGEGDITVDVKKQYKLIVKYYYDSAETGNEFMPSGVTTTEYTLNEGDSWSVSISTETGATHVAPEKVENGEGIQYVLDTALPITSDADGIKEDTVVELVYARDEWEDGTPDYKQARIVYEVAGDSTGMGSVSPTLDVVTLTDDDSDGVYSGEVKAESTAIPEDGNVFVKWSWTHDVAGTSTNETLSHEFTAVGGETYTYTASFKTGTTDAEVTKTLVSYTRDDVTVDEIPEGFKGPRRRRAEL